MTVITMFHSTRGIPKTNKDGKRIMSVTGVIGLDNPKHANNIQPHTILKRTEYCPIIGSFMMKKDSKITMSERINTLGCTSVCFPSRPNIPFKKEPLSRATRRNKYVPMTVGVK